MLIVERWVRGSGNHPEKKKENNSGSPWMQFSIVPRRYFCDGSFVLCLGV